MRPAVRGSHYRRWDMWIWQSFGLSAREYVLKRVNADGLSHTELAKEGGISRDRLYIYARANGVELTTQAVAVDLWAQMDTEPESATGTDG